MEIQELKESAKEAQENSQGFMEPKIDKPKGKRGRPKKEASEKIESPKKESAEKTEASENFDIPSTEIMKPLVYAMNSFAVKYAEDPRAQTTPAEAEAICQVGGKLIDKYAPGAFNKYGLELVMIITLGQWGLRVHSLRKQNLDKLMKEKYQNQQASVNTTPKGPEHENAEVKPAFDDKIEEPAAPKQSEERWN